MSSFDVEQEGAVDSGPGSRGVPEWVRTDGPGFSLCAAPLELSGPGFHGVEQRLGERVEVWRYTGLEIMERTLRVSGGAKVVKLIGDEVANELELRGLTWLIFELGLQHIGDSLL